MALLPVMLALAPAAALAQAPTREEIDRPDLRPDAAPPSRVSVDGKVESPPCPLDEDRYRGISVTVGAVTFDGLKGLPAEALAPSYAAFAGTTQPISVVCRIRDSATAILRDKGYLAAVQVPPQRIEDGNIRFDVVMGRLTSAHVRGDAGPAEATIASYLQRIMDQEVFNTHEAERYLLLIDDMPGYDMRLVLRPAGTGPGDLAGEVIVERHPFAADFSLQNFGSKDVGRFGGLLRASYYGLTGLADRTTLGIYSTADFKEQQVYQLGHDFRLGPDGIDLGGRITWAVTRPGGAASDPLKAETLLATIEAGYTPIRSRAKNLRLSGGLDIVDQDIDFAGAPLTRDRLRILFLRGEFNAMDRDSTLRGNRFNSIEPRWRLSGALEVRKGLDIFGASKGCGASLALCGAGVIPPSRIEGDPQATVLRAEAGVEVRPSPTLGFALESRAQIATDPLVAFEEVSGGNYTIGRGYDPGAITGDNGLGVKAEVRFGSLVPKAVNDLAVQPFAFADALWVWNKDRLLPAGLDKDHLYSAGGGVRIAYGNRARLDLFGAFPLSRTGIDNVKGDFRLLMSLAVRLWP